MILCSESFREFIKILAEDRIVKRVSSRAIASIADELHIGRIELFMNVPQSRNLIEGQNEKLVLYESPNGYAKDGCINVTKTTGDRGEAVLNCFGTADGYVWNEEERRDLEIVNEILFLYGARFRLIGLLQKTALTQYMTGLPNSGGYLRKVGEIFSRGEAAEYDAYYMNIKGMSLMNVKYGQREGDEIIKRYSRYLYSCLRPDEAMGHLGGDNFTAMIRKNHVKEWEELLSGVESFAMRNGEKCPITVQSAAGVMRLDETVEGPWMVMTGPSIAIQISKKTMNNLVELTPEMMEHSNRAQQVENEFFKALENGEFQPFFQPKVNMKNGEIVGAEVLARWLINGAVVPPGEFIPILEQTHEIAELDLYILEKTCRELRRWYDAGVRIVPLSVNISRKDLDLPDLSKRVVESIDRYGINHRDVVIEITETESAKENSVMMQFLHDLADAGIRTSIDDFGSGYSSLSFLRDFPVGEIKIDRSFINHQTLREKDRIIIGSIIDMAARLGVDVITEGVETKEQVAFLTELHCYRAQGFLFDRPLPIDQFEKRLAEGPYQI